MLDSKEVAVPPSLGTYGYRNSGFRFGRERRGMSQEEVEAAVPHLGKKPQGMTRSTAHVVHG
jgi:hypothetical protein